MTPAPRVCSDSRTMEASGEVKKEPAALAVHRDASAGKEGGRLVKRKRVASESEQVHKRSHGVNGVNSTSRTPSKSKSTKDTCPVNSTAGKRKRASSTAEDVDAEDDSALNAAQALFELFGGSGTSQKESPDRKSCDADGVKWAGKKSRSSRSKKADDCACKLSSTSTTSATVTDIPEVLDSSASHNHHVAVSQICHAGVETVNVEDESEADADAKSTDMSPCGFGFDRGHRLQSQSSVESTLLDSRAESPSSPLRVLKPEAPLLPKLEEELMLQFGFQRQTPVRPVVKPAILRKPKAEDNNCAVESDELKQVKIALNKVQRRKPRSSNSKGQPLLLQGDVLDVPITSSATVLKECIEENKFQVPVTLNLFEPVKLETGRVKVEGRELYQTGSSTQGRLRTALSEAEKEARRLRRVQANRESARQTIRRKQVLCEELARKAGELQTEKETLTQSLEQKTKELRNHQEINRHLKEQILIQAGNAEAPLSSTKASNMVSPVVPPTGPIQGMPLLPYWWAFALAQSVAAASQSAPPPPMGEPGAAPVAPDFNSVFAATVAAFNNGAGMNPNLWMSMMGAMPNMANMPSMANMPNLANMPSMANMTSMANMASMVSMPNMSGKKPQKPGMVATQFEQQAQPQQPSLAHPVARPTPSLESAPHKPAASLAGAPAQPQVLGRSPLAMNGHTQVSHPSGLPSSSPMKSGSFNVDPSVTMSRSQMNGSVKISSRGKYQTGLLNGGPSTLTRSVSGMTQMSQMHASADASTSTTLSLGLATLQSHQSHPGRAEQQIRKPSAAANLRFFPTIGNGVQGYLGPRMGAYQSEAAALATEARRRRRELKRTKSLQQSQLQQEKKLFSAKSL